MGKDKIRAAVVHMVPHPDRGALRDEVDRAYARHIRRCLEESPLNTEQKKQVLNELIALLQKQNNSFE